jgi:alkanesulfonate monooxygenase SsuD/methylene tetrahydromethanopterin reductase-like flavin-dependent oxidoreductase (luciferase family)
MNEQPMSVYPESEGERLGYTTLLFSNRYFNPTEASRLYAERLQEYVFAEEVGFDGLMLNEHHNGPFCMSSRANIVSAVLAGVTSRVRLVHLGNILPIEDNPVKLAEELAMIDLYSKGRLVSGFVRGGGVEQLAMNANPAFNRERFEEAHDLIIKTWTQPGPFRWDGTHYQIHVVNPWSLPLQKPHPPIWIPGTQSKETVVWAAEHGYPYIALNTTIETTKQIWATYDQTAERVGYQAGPEHHGYLLRCHVAETEEKAIENARQFLWMQGEFTGRARPEWTSPAGYNTPESRRARLLHASRYSAGKVPYEQQLADLTIVAGTPDQVIQKLRVLLEATRPSILALWMSDGRVNHADTMSCIRLMGQEVLPALRETGERLGLKSGLELDAPVSVESRRQSAEAALI